MGYFPEDDQVVDRLQREIGRTNHDKGFRDDWKLADRLEEIARGGVSPDISGFEWSGDLLKAAKALRINVIGMKIALCHSELSEMLSDLRDSGNDVLLAPEGIDTIIRTLDLLDMHGEAAGKELVTKMRKNKGRERMHGRQA